MKIANRIVVMGASAGGLEVRTKVRATELERIARDAHQ
jgi:hypothetical protein